MSADGLKKNLRPKYKVSASFYENTNQFKISFETFFGEFILLCLTGFHVAVRRILNYANFFKALPYFFWSSFLLLSGSEGVV